MSGLEKYKRELSHKYRLEISRLEKTQERDNTTLNNLTKSGYDQEFVQKKQKELSSNIDKRLDEIFSLKGKLTELESGKLDSSLEEELTKNSKVALSKGVESQKKKVETKKENETKKQAMYTKQNNENSFERQQEKDYKYFFKQFCKIEESIPPYMRENLKEMPSNKGYLWRGCWELGKLPPDSDTVTIFEKCRDNLLKIHEYDQYEYRLFEKVGRDRKQLVLRQPRIKKKCFKR